MLSLKTRLALLVLAESINEEPEIELHMESLFTSQPLAAPVPPLTAAPIPAPLEVAQPVPITLLPTPGPVTQPDAGQGATVAAVAADPALVATAQPEAAVFPPPGELTS